MTAALIIMGKAAGWFAAAIALLILGVAIVAVEIATCAHLPYLPF